MPKLFFINIGELKLRITKLWYLKALGNTVFVYSFFVLYFYLLKNPAKTIFVMPLTLLDGKMPYWEFMVYIYCSLWVYTALPPALLQKFSRLCFYGLAITSLSTFGLWIYYVFPAAVPREFQLSIGKLPILSDVDGVGNAFPSMHVAAAVFSALWLRRILFELQASKAVHVLSLLWTGAIVLSTLSTRQHVLLDLIAGVPLGAVFAAFFLYWDRKLFQSSAPAQTS